MLHARRRIVIAAKAVLDGLIADGVVTSVHAGRAEPSTVDAFPFLLVYARQERSAPLTTGGPGRRMDRELTLSVEAATSGDDDDAAVDAIALAVERALAAEPTLGGAASDIYLSATTLDSNVENETRVGRIRLDFTAVYHTPAGAPDRAL